MGTTWLADVKKTFPARYRIDHWSWCHFEEVLEVVDLPADVLIDVYANIGAGWNLIVLGEDKVRRLWTSVDTQTSTDFLVPVGWVRALTEFCIFEQPLSPDKQIELLTDIYREQGYFVFRIKGGQKIEKLRFINPLIEKFRAGGQVGVRTLTASLNEHDIWETEDVVVYNSAKWVCSTHDPGEYSNGLSPLYRITGSIRLDRQWKHRLSIPSYLHPIGSKF